MFLLQLKSEVVWKWREVCWPPRKVFTLLQESILPLGYRLSESSWERVGYAFAQSIRRFRRKIETISNGKKRKEVRADTWINFAIHSEEIERSPRDVMAQLTEENDKLHAAVEGKVAELYDAMHHKLAHTSKHFTEVVKLSVVFISMFIFVTYFLAERKPKMPFGLGKRTA